MSPQRKIVTPSTQKAEETTESTKLTKAQGTVEIISGVHNHTLPLAGLTVKQVRAMLQEKLGIHPQAIGVVDGNQVDEDTKLENGQVLNFVRVAGEKGATDILKIEGNAVTLTTEEGRVTTHTTSDLERMYESEFSLPVHGKAFPDGLKFIEWRNPYLLVVHQQSPQVRSLKWIAENSPKPYGPGTKYRQVRVAIPYAITFAMFRNIKGDAFSISGSNELYFKNEPLKSLNDNLGYPTLLNVSKIAQNGRDQAWICTQHLERSNNNWIDQLTALLNHTWNGGFNLSSEHNEGASWFGASKNVHPDLNTIEKWEKATTKDERFVLGVNWKSVPLTVGELMDKIFELHFGMKVRGVKVAASNGPKNEVNIVKRFRNFTLQAK